MVITFVRGEFLLKLSKFTNVKAQHEKTELELGFSGHRVIGSCRYDMKINRVMST